MKAVGPTGGEVVVRRVCEHPLQDMSSCYSTLKGLVPTLPTGQKASRVEILQHVIDYIWDLQLELDSPGAAQGPRGPTSTHTPLTMLNTETSSTSVESGCSDDRILCS